MGMLLLAVSSSGPEASLNQPIRFNCIANAVYNVVEWGKGKKTLERVTRALKSPRPNLTGINSMC